MEKLNDTERAYYAALDPNAMTSEKPWEFEVRSPFLRKVSFVVIAVVMAVHIFAGVTVGMEDTGATVTSLDQWAFPGVGLIISVLAYLAFNRPRVRANSDGVEVRNIIGTRFYPWQLIYGLNFPQGSRMALLELPEFEYVPLWAIQSGDGPRAIESVDAFRELEAAYMPKD